MTMLMDPSTDFANPAAGSVDRAANRFGAELSEASSATITPTAPTAPVARAATSWFSVFSRLSSLWLGLGGAVHKHLRDERGMSTIEYALGCVAAAALGALLYTVVTSDAVESALSNIFERALNEG